MVQGVMNHALASVATIIRQGVVFPDSLICLFSRAPAN
jgi:hypothetical protein